MSNSPSAALERISVPQGGGAIQGLGEKFSPDLHTGTGNFSVPISVPPGRNGFQPELSLGFSTGQGNGVFGLGWTLSVPGVTRKTSDGVPHYNEASQLPHQRRADVFILSGSEDLVKVDDSDPARVRYQPRTEGLFAEIIHDTSADDQWQVQSTNGIASVYQPAHRDPGDGSRIFSWCLLQSVDPFGNRIDYVHESRPDGDGLRQWSEHLLRAIRYVDYEDAGQRRYLLSVEFDYEDRPDRFSDYRSGFEIRVTQRCRSIRVMTHPRGGAERISRQYNLIYEQSAHNGVSLLTGIEISGENDDPSVPVEAHDLPPALLFGYTQLGKDSDQRQFIKVAVEGRTDLPLSHPDLDFVDLHGNGLPDLLDTRAGWHYWRNLSDGQFDVRRPIRQAPPFQLSSPGVAVIDADGDGRPDLVATLGQLSGRFPLSHDMAWNPAPPELFSVAPSVSLEDPQVRLLDMDGDGLPDVLHAGSTFNLFFADRDGREAWKTVVTKARRSLAEFPNISFSDPRVRTADLCGDGLQDILVIHEGAVEVWPNLGHGEWAPLRTLPVEPRLPRDFDPRLLLVGDVDGDGLADLVLVDAKGVRVWINQSGNRFVEYPMRITGTPMPNSSTTLRLIDLNGSGVSGLLWTQTAEGSTRPASLFLDFTTGSKPNLLNRMDNQMGAVTSVEYASSSQYFLADFRHPRTRWRTPLPFPVQVVAKVTVKDAISGGRLTTEYHYHHGYWDGAEREFRGFGMVETLDTEEILDPRLRVQEHFAQPLKTKTWFHQGPIGPEHGDWQEVDYTHEYWSGDPQLLDHTSGVNSYLRTIPQRRARRDALRTLRGSILRSELYALDDSPLRERPYTVTEYAYSLREESPPAAGGERSRIFFPHLIAQRTTQWERGDDPMTQFSFTAGHDAFGQPRLQTTVVPPRLQRHQHAVVGAGYCSINLNEQRSLVQHVFTDYAQPSGRLRILDRPAQVRSYTCKALPAGPDTIADDPAAALGKQHRQALALHEQFAPAVLPSQGPLPAPDPAFAELIGHQIHHYDGNADEGLPMGEVGAFGMLTRTEVLVLTEEILQEAYGARRPDYLGGTAAIPPIAELQTFGADLGYHPDPAGSGEFWVDTVRHAYDVQLGASSARGLLLRVTDARGHQTSIDYDRHALLPVKVTDAAGLEIRAEYNERLLQPASVTDPNGTITHVLYTALGLPERQYLESADASQGGTGSSPELRFGYGFDRFLVSGSPIHVETWRRVEHAKTAGASVDTIRSRDCSDGFGRLVQTRTQAEDLVFGERGDEVGLPGQAGAAVRPAVASPLADAVVVSGFQEYDSKGRVIRRYEPCFDSGFDYQPGRRPANAVCVTQFHDPRGQVVRTVHADGSEQRVVFGVPGSITAPQLDDPGGFAPTAWESYLYDANDLAPFTHASSAVPASHHFTPSSTLLDGMGRGIAQIVRNGPSPSSDWHITRSGFDVRGNLLSISDALGRVAFQHSYDLLNRPLKVASIDAGLRTSVLDALGNLVEYRDSKGSLVLRRYDQLNRLTELWARDRDEPNSRFSLRELLSYGPAGAANYAAGRLIEHRDEAGIQRIHTYDFQGNILESSRRVPADGAMADWLADWSAAGTTATELRLEPQAYVITRSYDALKRIKAITYPEDVNGERAQLTPTYNRAGALKAVALQRRASSPFEPFVAQIAYNARGQRVLIAYGNGVMTRHAYDPKTFRLARLRSERFQQPDAQQWIGLGPATGLNDELLQDYSYRYDLAGNILSIEERVRHCGVRNPDPDQLLRQFDYDPVYRLTRATGRSAAQSSPAAPYEDRPMSGFHAAGNSSFNQANGPDLTEHYSEDYHYDPAGNMLAMGHSQGGTRWVRQFTHAATSNRLSSIVVGSEIVTCEQDPNGNLIRQAQNHHHDWDHADRMTGYRNQNGSAASVQARYVYGADGMRVKKWVRRGGSANDEESTIYIGGIFECHRWSDSGVVKENNHLQVMDNRSRVAMQRIGPAHHEVSAPKVQYQLGDHLGCSSLVMGGSDATGAAFLNREEYSPFGETSFGSFGRKRYRFSGKERDDESGLLYFGARYFASWICRWASCDPMGAAAGLNCYRYCANNSINLKDTEGYQEEAVNEDVAEKSPKPDRYGRDDNALLGPLRRWFGLTDADNLEDEAMRNLDVDAAKLHEAREIRAKGLEGAGNTLAATAQIIEAAVPGPISNPSTVRTVKPSRWERFKSWVREIPDSLSNAHSHSSSKALPGTDDFVPSWAVTAESQAGWRRLTLSEFSPDEMRLVQSVLNAQEVIAGRSVNVKGRNMLVLDTWLDDNGIKWSQRWQDVYNKALFERTSAGKPVNVMAGGGYTLGEVNAAEAGAQVSRIKNRPYWPDN